MTERTGAVTINGAPLTLLGDELKPGVKAPGFVLTDNDMKPFSLSDLKGKVAILSCVPSLDTPTCDLETRRFNKEAASLSSDISIVTVSMDLPFAQKRWCGAAGVERVKTVSDYRGADFAVAYGVLIKELHLLARAVFVLDREGVVRYVQLVREVSSEPDYAAVLSAAAKLVK